MAPYEKPLATARDVSSSRKWNYSYLSVSFRAAGKSHANTKKKELPGFKNNYLSGKGSSRKRSVVALSQQGGNKALMKQSFWPRENQKSSVGADLHRMSIGGSICAFPCTHGTWGERRTVDSKHDV